MGRVSVIALLIALSFPLPASAVLVYERPSAHPTSTALNGTIIVALFNQWNESAGFDYELIRAYLNQADEEGGG